MCRSHWPAAVAWGAGGAVYGLEHWAAGPLSLAGAWGGGGHIAAGCFYCHWCEALLWVAVAGGCVEWWI